MLIDYDKTFPESARALALDGAEILTCLFAWPASLTNRAPRMAQDRCSTSTTRPGRRRTRLCWPPPTKPACRSGDCAFFRPVDPRVELRIAPFPDIVGEEIGPRILRSIQVLADAFDPAGYDVVHAQDCISANAVGSGIRTVHHIDHFSTPELAACHERAIVDPYAHIRVSAAVTGELLDAYALLRVRTPGPPPPNNISTSTGASANPECHSEHGPEPTSPEVATNTTALGELQWTSVTRLVRRRYRHGSYRP